MSDKGAEYWINAIDRDILEPDKIHVYIDHLRSEVTALREALTAAGELIARHENLVTRFKGSVYAARIKETWHEYVKFVAAMKKVEAIK